MSVAVCGGLTDRVADAEYDADALMDGEALALALAVGELVAVDVREGVRDWVALRVPVGVCVLV